MNTRNVPISVIYVHSTTKFTIHRYIGLPGLVSRLGRAVYMSECVLPSEFRLELENQQSAVQEIVDPLSQINGQDIKLLSYICMHGSSEGSSSITNPKPRGSHSSACSGTPISCFCKRQSHLGA